MDARVSGEDMSGSHGNVRTRNAIVAKSEESQYQQLQDVLIVRVG